MVFFGERGAQLPLPASAGRLTDVVYHTYSNHPEFVKDGWSNGWSNDKHLGQMEIHRCRCYIVVYKLCMIYISYSLIHRYMIYSYTPTLSVHCNVWQNACISGGSNPRVFDVQTVKHGWTPIVDHLCSFKAPFLMLKTLAFVSSKLGSPQAKLLATRIRWKELNGMTTFLQSLDDFFRDGAMVP